jgi:hypothetical protein
MLETECVPVLAGDRFECAGSLNIHKDARGDSIRLVKWELRAEDYAIRTYEFRTSHFADLQPGASAVVENITSNLAWSPGRAQLCFFHENNGVLRLKHESPLVHSWRMDHNVCQTWSRAHRLAVQAVAISGNNL